MEKNENAKIEIWFWIVLILLFVVFPALYIVFSP